MQIQAGVVPLIHAPPTTRVAYLRKVATLTLGGLSISAVTGLLSAYLLAPLLTGRWTALVVILGSFFMANTVARNMVFSGQRMAGFLLGTVFQGVAMGYLLLAAMVVSSAALGSPWALIGEALGLTVLSAGGITAWLWSNPKDFSRGMALMSALSLPFLALMVISFIWPIGGPLGMLIAAAFVAISAFGLTMQINAVLHQLDETMEVEGAYMITMGVLVLFWNILALLMRLQRR